ncbi:hypothetical protein L1987_18724 [Smallanthus sonchifolius]|uniref:Uncharacterized protein n=1 Tax=Smallanthus sonchifolius TaxID=185202 RepID=A0ACB9J2K5_9ASTR|nr:hypothetical protein L1987_18724 [Smallanthus sonchifolius]
MPAKHVSGEIEEVQEQVNHALMANEVIEKKYVCTNSGAVNIDEKLKAPKTESFRFSVPGTADEKKMQIDELVVNKKGMVLEVATP